MTDLRTDTVHWIDHYVTMSDDIPRWAAFNAQVLGAVTCHDPTGVLPGVFQQVGRTRYGGFMTKSPMRPTKGIGAGLPRYGYYINAADIDEHLRRLKTAGAIHKQPVHESSAGDEGTSIFWQDPDGNQFEFWAPDELPEGAMDGCGPERIGRISHAVFESRDLDRTAAFFKRYCELEPIRSKNVADNILSLRLAAGGRLVFERVTELGWRTTGMGLRDQHTALLVHEDSFFPNYQRLWNELPEWDYDPSIGLPIPNGGTLPARSVMHPSPAGRRFFALAGRGDDFFDWDTNMFHFYGGTPIGSSLTRYRGRSVESYIGEWEQRENN